MSLYIYVLDSDFQKVGIIDAFSSIIFTRRYNDVGEFELYAPADKETVDLLTKNPYIQKDDDDTLWVIRKISLSSDVDNGAYITASGPNVEGVLDQRIIWSQTNFSGTVENAIRKFVDDNAITTDAAREIPGLILGDLAGLPDMITIQKTGQNLLETITELCKAHLYGYRVRFSGGNLIFELYSGTVKNVYFSPEYDNLLSSKYDYSDEAFKNVALIAGEGEGTARTRAEIGTASGMNRREVYVDARDLSTNDGEITADQYVAMLETRGAEKLAENAIAENYEGEVSTANTYVFGVDYGLGDIVNVVNEYGMTATTRIIETIECEDENGYTFIPTFDAWEVQ